MTTITQMNIGVRPLGYRLPEAAHIGRVRLQIENLTASLDYYTRVLGLHLLSQNSAVAVLGPEGGPALVELHERRGVRRVPRGGRLGLYHFAILLPDRASLGRFVGHLADVGEYAGSADHIVSEALYLTDPDGLGIEVYADRPREEWASSGREIVMATEPLDLRSLLRAGGGEPWHGVPPRTTIGHVHFHVGMIGEAERFYHVALGLDKVVWSYRGALFFSAGGYHHHVGTNTWAEGASISTTDDARLLEWELVLPGVADVLAAAANAAESGHAVREDGDDRLISDPWGITVRITHRSNRQG